MTGCQASGYMPCRTTTILPIWYADWIARRARYVCSRTTAAKGTESAQQARLLFVYPSHLPDVTCLLPQITDKDAPVLQHLTDISSQDSEKGGFKLVFRFAKNEFFDHETLVRQSPCSKLEPWHLCAMGLMHRCPAGEGVRDGR